MGLWFFITTSLAMCNLCPLRKIFILPKSVFVTLRVYLAKAYSLLEYFLTVMISYLSLMNSEAFIYNISTDIYSFPKAYLKLSQLISETWRVLYSVQYHILMFSSKSILAYLIFFMSMMVKSLMTFSTASNHSFVGTLSKTKLPQNLEG